MVHERNLNTTAVSLFIRRQRRANQCPYIRHLSLYTPNRHIVIEWSKSDELPETTLSKVTAQWCTLNALSLAARDGDPLLDVEGQSTFLCVGSKEV